MKNIIDMADYYRTIAVLATISNYFLHSFAVCAHIQVHDRKCIWVYGREVPETFGRIIWLDKKFRLHSTALNSKWSMNISVQSGIIVEFVVTRYETS